MGCDIHVHVEYKRSDRWMCGDYFRLNPHHGRIDGEEKYTLVGFCDKRNYNLFATLADVRNYGETDYIADPRGLPSDVTEEVRSDYDCWGDDGHSHSYFTLKELIDWHNEGHRMKYSGMISREAAEKLDKHGEAPESWCQWTSIPGWVRREWSEENTVLVPLIEALKIRANELYLIYSWMWERDYAKAYEQSENIRIVFWFDN